MGKKETLWWRNREDIKLYERAPNEGSKLLTLGVMCLFVFFSLMLGKFR